MYLSAWFHYFRLRKGYPCYNYIKENTVTVQAANNRAECIDLNYII